jgi:hypothetical protein
MEGYAHQPAHEGERVAEGQRAMQLQSDPFLGWTAMESRHYLVRQLNDHKGSISVDDLHGAGLEEYAHICGELLARGHARSGDAVVLHGYVGKGGSLGEALTAFGLTYADQSEQDHKQLVRSKLGDVGKPAASMQSKDEFKPAAKRGVVQKLAAKSAAPARKKPAAPAKRAAAKKGRPEPKQEVAPGKAE